MSKWSRPEVGKVVEWRRMRSFLWDLLSVFFSVSLSPPSLQRCMGFYTVVGESFGGKMELERGWKCG